MDESLQQLHRGHDGKVSDKWQHYLVEYDRLFFPWRDKPVKLLELGVQNGGSLEIWAKYFLSASLLLGCDIDPRCAALRYQDPRIQVLVADATTAETQVQLEAISKNFDIIIEDASHLSKDIIGTFLRLFPLVNPGGVFIAEDLHCAYWMEFGGGLGDSFSAMTFLKELADIVNISEWGLEVSASEYLKAFSLRYGFDFTDFPFGDIHSVEFIRSLCVVRKKDSSVRSLANRQVSGREAIVDPSVLDLDGHQPRVPSQNEYTWSARHDQAAQEWKAQGGDMATLVKRLLYLEAQIKKVRSSLSWKLTAPLRRLGHLLRRLKKG